MWAIQALSGEKKAGAAEMKTACVKSEEAYSCHVRSAVAAYHITTSDLIIKQNVPALTADMFFLNMLFESSTAITLNNNKRETAHF